VSMSTEEILRGEHLRHGIKFTNMGRTAADIGAYQIHIGFFDWKNETLNIEQIEHNGDFSRVLGGSEATEMLEDVVLDIHEFAKNPAAEVHAWKNWLVVLVSVTYRHVFSHKEANEVFRFVFNPRTGRMRRAQVTEADKKQARDNEIAPIEFRMGTAVPAPIS